MKTGFTLIELLASIAIASITATEILPFVSSYRRWNERKGRPVMVSKYMRPYDPTKRF